MHRILFHRVSFHRTLFHCTPFQLRMHVLLDLQVPSKILVEVMRFKVWVDGRSEVGLDEAGCAAPGEVQGVVGVDSDGDEMCFLEFEHEVRHQDCSYAVGKE